MSKKRTLTNSFEYALEGVKEAFQNEPNFRIHVLASILVVILGIYLKISKNEWMIITLTVTIVITLELLNTAIEKLVDMASPKTTRLAKIAKDVAASAVLVSSISAVIIGMIIFLPKII